MAPNLLSYLQQQVSGEALSHLSSFLGESADVTSRAASSGLQTVLVALTQRASSPQGTTDVLGLLARVTGDNGLGQVAARLTSGADVDDLVTRGAPLVGAVLGGHQAGVTDWLSSSSGLGKGATGSLLALLVPFALSGVSRYLTSTGSGVNASTLAHLLSSQSAPLLAHVPAALAGALGIDGLPHAGHGEHAGHGTSQTPDDPRDTSLGFLKWVLPLIAIAALVTYMYRWSSTMEHTAQAAQATVDDLAAAADRASAAADAAAAAAAGAAADLGAVVERSLPGLPSIHVPEHGIESRLLAFITDASRAVDTTTWFSFDRIEFDTASATLRASSNDQLDAMAAILKAYPNVSLKIGGYTDNVGDETANQALSASRAENTKQALVTRGIAAARLDAEGYGEEHPVASNDTEVGRQRNRRIDVRVTAK